jgi:hypothetical protein
MTCGTQLFGLWNVLQAGLEPVMAAAEAGVALKFSQHNMLLGCFP